MRWRTAPSSLPSTSQEETEDLTLQETSIPSWQINKDSLSPNRRKSTKGSKMTCPRRFKSFLFNQSWMTYRSKLSKWWTRERGRKPMRDYTKKDTRVSEKKDWGSMRPNKLLKSKHLSGESHQVGLNHLTQAGHTTEERKLRQLSMSSTQTLWDKNKKLFYRSSSRTTKKQINIIV